MSRFNKHYFNILFFSVSVILLTACGGNSLEGKLIISEAPPSGVQADYITGEGWRCLPESRLAAIDPQNPSAAPEILTKDFYSAAMPDLSYDGERILFAARKEKDDPWQIWEMNLRNLKSRQVTKTNENCIDPAYMPGDRLVFSRSVLNDSLKAGYSLFTSNIDGSDVKRITFNPHTYFASTLIKDGRVLTISRQVYPSVTEAVVMVLRPDGTKAELFFDTGNKNTLISSCHECDNGKIYFIGRQSDTGKGTIMSVDYNRPLNSMKSVSGTDKDFLSVAKLSDNSIAVSCRTDNGGRYELFGFDTNTGVTGSKIYGSADYDVTDIVYVAPYIRPRKLPSEVDMGVKTGLILCQNINVTGMTSPEAGFSLPLADRIEIMGVDSSLGMVKVENDGSVYLKVAADIPFRIRTLDAKGSVVNGPGGWYYLRPNERRGCIGCHEDREMVPANRYAVAVSKNPVAVPVHYEGIKEKEVELE